MLANAGFKEIFGVLSVLLGIANLTLYFWVIIKEKIKPHALSWLLWAIVMGIVFAAQYTDAAGAGAWQTGVGAVLTGVIGVLALFRGERNITRTDWISFGGALSAIPLWMLTKNPLGSVILLTLIDALGYYPTFRKSYEAPYEENVSWTFRGAVAFVLSIIALEHYNWTTILYPFVMVIIQTTLGVMILWRRSKVRV